MRPLSASNLLSRKRARNSRDQACSPDSSTSVSASRKKLRKERDFSVAAASRSARLSVRLPKRAAKGWHLRLKQSQAKQLVLLDGLSRLSIQAPELILSNQALSSGQVSSVRLPERAEARLARFCFECSDEHEWYNYNVTIVIQSRGPSTTTGSYSYSAAFASGCRCVMF